MRHFLLNVAALLFLVAFFTAVAVALGWKLWHGMRLLTQAISELWSR